jgi:cytosine/adenosine deaminase-related metal-dependent hydrolase
VTWWTRAVTFVNAVVIGHDGRIHDALRVRAGIIDALGEAPQRHDVVVDVNRAIISAGLVNAHDHLELNSFPRLKWRPQYENVREWIADFQPRFRSDPALSLARHDTLADRLWVGGLKNVLCGVTTVCHHNPMHPPLRRRFPVRLVRRLGLSHSLHIDGAGVAVSYRQTPSAWPWIIHAAEGIDAAAREEVSALSALRCLGENTVLVHGVAVDEAGSRRVLKSGGWLVWCPSSNDFLFGQTASVDAFARARRLALGSDSRLSGEGDLLDELRAAARTRQLSAEKLVRTVTADAAAALRLPDAGRLSVGQPADLVMLRSVAADPFESIANSTRADVRLTMLNGLPLVGDPGVREVFTATRQRHVPARLDGAPRLVAQWIARRVAAMRIREPGFEVAC